MKSRSALHPTHPRRSLVAAMGCLALLVAACSEAAPPETTVAASQEVSSTTATTEASVESTATATTAVTATLPDPDPASAEVTLDSSAAVSALIGPDGGSIAAAGSDGRSYVLTIPPNYLANEVEITMIPIADLSTPILDEFSGGVQFSPEGLAFPGVAWLEIAGADVPEKAVGFSYVGAGEDAAIGWVDAEGTAIRVPITHFSGAGAGTPAPGAGTRYPRDAVATMAVTLTSAWIANNALCIDATNPIGEVLPAWYEALFEAEVEPKLEQAATDDTLLPDAIRAALRWRAARHYYQPVLCDDLFKALDNTAADQRLDELVGRGLENAIGTAADSCATTHDLGETRYILAWLANAQLLFGDEDGNWSRLAQERIAGCLTFELEFRSLIEVTNPGLNVFTGHMESTISGLMPLANSLSLSLIDGRQDDGSRAGPLAYTPSIDFTYDDSCSILVTQVETRPALALFPEVKIPAPIRQIDVIINRDDVKQPEKFLLVFFPLAGSEFFETSCTDLFGGPNQDGAWGPYTFNNLHEDEMNPVYEGFSIEMERETGKLYGSKAYKRELTREGATIFEETTFDLFHDAPRVP
jgi:hypothetical protein